MLIDTVHISSTFCLCALGCSCTPPPHPFLLPPVGARMGNRVLRVCWVEGETQPPPVLPSNGKGWNGNRHRVLGFGRDRLYLPLLKGEQVGVPLGMDGIIHGPISLVPCPSRTEAHLCERSRWDRRSRTTSDATGAHGCGIGRRRGRERKQAKEKHDVAVRVDEGWSKPTGRSTQGTQQGCHTRG